MKKKSKKKRRNKALASISKEMAQPRFAASARKDEEEANHRAMRHNSFMDPWCDC
jgi:hypothetical protein